MRPQLSWSELPGRRVGIYGLGREGEANLRACLVRGINPILVDDQPSSTTPAVLKTSEGGSDALLGCEVVIKTPGISPDSETIRTLKANGVSVVGGLGLWLKEADPRRVLCVTGTKGKSTTTSLAGHLLTQWGYRCLMGGNLGVSPFDPDIGADFDYWVVEVSSYQATSVPISPRVTVVTSLHPDHLPWHRNDVDTYYRDKLSLCTQPGADLTIANGDSPLIRERRSMLGPRVEWVHDTDSPSAAWVDALGLLGLHNRRNALLAQAALAAMRVPEATDDSALLRAATGFQGLHSRLEVIGRGGDVLFVDDSLSTNVLSALAAVDVFPNRRVALIVGGQDRGIDYLPLAVGLRDRDADLRVIAIPDSGPRIASEVIDNCAVPTVTVAQAQDLADAVRAGYEWARPNGVVLLSPAAPSFGRFRDYQERSEAFTAAMIACGGVVERP
jgi:UDP-N-acetylmuramoylalanine--D-glutamate ligase